MSTTASTDFTTTTTTTCYLLLLVVITIQCLLLPLPVLNVPPEMLCVSAVLKAAAG